MLADLLPTEDQAMIRQSVEDALDHLLPLARLRDTSSHGGGGERRAWPQLAELGLFGMGLASEAGGVGYGLPEEIVAARELGRRLISPSVLATMLACHLAPPGSPMLARLIAGDARAAFASLLDDDLEGGGPEADLIDAEGAVLAVAWNARHAALIPVLPDALGRLLPGMDESLTLHRTPLAVEQAVATLPGAGLRADLLVSAYLAGMAEATRDMAVAYAGERVQFGQPIGAFQAVKHACADMAVRAEAAVALTFYATLAFGAGGDGLAREVASARLIAGQAALENAKANIQIHGAMGFTQECDAHLYLKRAHLIAALNGSRVGQLAKLAP